VVPIDRGVTRQQCAALQGQVIESVVLGQPQCVGEIATIRGPVLHDRQPLDGLDQTGQSGRCRVVRRQVGHPGRVREESVGLESVEHPGRRV
jgi:hypothetical protein